MKMTSLPDARNYAIRDFYMLALFGLSARREPPTFLHWQFRVIVFAFECVRLACECVFFDPLECAFDCIICIQDR